MEIIKIGMPINLDVDRGPEEEEDKYKCKLVDFQGEYIYIDYPVHTSTGKTGFFMEGAQFQASFVGEDQSVYWFETEVVARKKLNIPVIVLTFPGMEKLERIQRRRYVRVETSVDVSIMGEEGSHTTVTSDISGGGVAVVQPKTRALQEGEDLNMMLVLGMNSGEYYYVETRGTVIRVIQQKNGNPPKVSVEFDDILDKHRQKVIQFCFEQQMHMRRRRLE